MTTIVDKGWLYLTDGTDILRLWVEEIAWDYHFEIKASHFAGGGHLGYHLGKEWITVYANGVLFDSETDMENTLKYLSDWNNDAPFTLKIQTTVAGNYVLIDGVNSTITVLAKDIKQVKKIAPGDQTVWKLQNVIFEQCG